MASPVCCKAYRSSLTACAYQAAQCNTPRNQENEILSAFRPCVKDKPLIFYVVFAAIVFDLKVLLH